MTAQLLFLTFALGMLTTLLIIRTEMWYLKRKKR